MAKGGKSLGRYHSGMTPMHPAGKRQTGGDQIGGKKGATTGKTEGMKTFAGKGKK